MQQQPTYHPRLDLVETERGIKLIKDTFERRLAAVLRLQRVSAPKYLEYGDGVQDDLAGTQEPVRFHVEHTENPIEMVHSLAKWKRAALARYRFTPGTGLYTDMDAIRKDEHLDETHSHYVDQWDWELIIRREQRTIAFLRDIVEKIYSVLREVEGVVRQEFPALESRLPESIAFVHTQDLEDEYPDLAPAERENRAAERYGAFFLRGIGGKLRSGSAHDLRAADYDDWITEVEPGRAGLNGDIIVYDATRAKALELSSMGIRVDAESMRRQLREAGREERLEMDFHRGVVGGRLPLTVGGGLGQSRICMLLLQKLHIGEVQVSVWPKEMREAYGARGAVFL